MNSDDQRRVIQEQAEANERIIRAVEPQQRRVFQGQAPVNERVLEQIPPNERIQQVKPTIPTEKKSSE